MGVTFLKMCLITKVDKWQGCKNEIKRKCDKHTKKHYLTVVDILKKIKLKLAF